MKIKTKNLSRHEFVSVMVTLGFHKVEAEAIASYLALHPGLPSGQRGYTYEMKSNGKYSVK